MYNTAVFTRILMNDVSALQMACIATTVHYILTVKTAGNPYVSSSFDIFKLQPRYILYTPTLKRMSLSAIRWPAS
jgi:hypothetical protein